MDRVINSSTNMAATPDDMSTNVAVENAPNLVDVNGAPGSMDEDGELDSDVEPTGVRNEDGTITPPVMGGESFPVNDDQTPRIYGMTLSKIVGTEHTDCTVLYAAPHGQSTKRKLFDGPVTAYTLASALIDIDNW